MSLIFILMLYLFNFELIFIISLWTVVLISSPLQNVIFTQVKPLIYSAVEEYFKITDKISN